MSRVYLTQQIHQVRDAHQQHQRIIQYVCRQCTIETLLLSSLGGEQNRNRIHQWFFALFFNSSVSLSLFSHRMKTIVLVPFVKRINAQWRARNTATPALNTL